MATMSSGDGSVGNEVFSVTEALKGREGSAPLAALGWAPGGAALITGGADWTADSTASSESELTSECSTLPLPSSCVTLPAPPLPSSAKLTWAALRRRVVGGVEPVGASSLLLLPRCGGDLWGLDGWSCDAPASASLPAT
jgi:hypothetical protein